MKVETKFTKKVVASVEWSAKDILKLAGIDPSPNVNTVQLLIEKSCAGNYYFQGDNPVLAVKITYNYDTTTP